VAILYAFFQDQNYFELEDVSKGLVATGPIAAYVVVVWLGLRAFKSVNSGQPRLSDAEERMVGTRWSFDSESVNQSRRKGSFRVSALPEGGLRLQGNFEKVDGTPAGDWDSTMTRCEKDLLQIVYDLTDSGKDNGEAERSTGLLSLHAKDDPDLMSGTWAVLGRAGAAGQMNCHKVKI
jgi:hypothetical protein